MTAELKATVINLKTLSQDIPDPIVVGAGDMAGRKLRIIFTQEAAAQFTPNTKVYLAWYHQEKNVKGYNVFTEIEGDFPPTWEISYPKAMLYEGNVLACIQIVDKISIATSVNFAIHILTDPNTQNEESDVNEIDYSNFQNIITQVTNLLQEMSNQMTTQQNEFEEIQSEFGEMVENSENALQIAEEALDRIEDATATAQESATEARNYINSALTWNSLS